MVRSSVNLSPHASWCAVRGAWTLASGASTARSSVVRYWSRWSAGRHLERRACPGTRARGVGSGRDASRSRDEAPAAASSLAAPGQTFSPPSRRRPEAVRPCTKSTSGTRRIARTVIGAPAPVKEPPRSSDITGVSATSSASVSSRTSPPKRGYVMIAGERLDRSSAPTFPCPLDRESKKSRCSPCDLIQSSLLLVNTLLLQQVLADPEWASRLTDADPRGLAPLFWSKINPYGTFHLDGPQARSRDPGRPRPTRRPRIARYPQVHKLEQRFELSRVIVVTDRGIGICRLPCKAGGFTVLRF